MPADDLWSFAKRFYAEPGVSEICIALQDEAGADVCVVLHLLHLSAAGRKISRTDLQTLEAVARPWRETVVVPLRNIRRGLRQSSDGYEGAETLRRSVGALELEAERIELERLGTHPIPERSKMPPVLVAQANLSLYCDLLQRPYGSIDSLLRQFASYCVRAASNETSG